MSKRPSVDLSALTSATAAPMQEAVQRAAPRPVQPVAQIAASLAPEPPLLKPESEPKSTPTANLQALAFKVSPAFRRRFRQRAANADLKLNELLFAALEAWEEKQGLKK